MRAKTLRTVVRMGILFWHQKWQTQIPSHQKPLVFFLFYGCFGYFGLMCLCVPLVVPSVGLESTIAKLDAFDSTIRRFDVIGPGKRTTVTTRCTERPEMGESFLRSRDPAKGHPVSFGVSGIFSWGFQKKRTPPLGHVDSGSLLV